jgi:hypothetical protein
MENMPATLNTSEKARKYHFFPRKSIFVLRKNSTEGAPYLNRIWYLVIGQSSRFETGAGGGSSPFNGQISTSPNHPIP